MFMTHIVVCQLNDTNKEILVSKVQHCVPDFRERKKTVL